MHDGAAGAIAARRNFALGELTGAFEDGQVTFAGPQRGEDGAAEAVELAPDVEAVREHVRFDDHGRYRPLSGARTLPSGWRVSLPEQLAEATLEAVYPQALLHQQQAAQGTLRIVGWEEVVGRQRGRYRVAGELDEDGRERAQRVLCGECVRTPVWAGEATVAGSVSDIPCPEPCSVKIALCREAALLEREPPPASSPDATVAFADFAAEGNATREAYLASAPAGAVGAGR